MQALYTFLYWFLLLMIYSCAGWLYESTVCSIGQRKLVNRGFLNGPLCPVYGFGAVFVLITVGKVEQLLPLFLSAAILTTMLEYFTSWAMEKLFHARWWDYSKRRFNIHGRVCLLGAVVFGVLAVFIVRVVHPRVESFLAGFSPITLMIVSAVLLVLFIADIVDTVYSLMQMNGHIAELQAAMDRYKADADWRMQELRELLEESRAELKLKSELAAVDLHNALEEREEKRQLRLAELRRGLEQRFEDTEDARSHRTAMEKRIRWNQKRLLHAFPGMKSTRYTSAMDQVRSWVDHPEKKK